MAIAILAGEPHENIWRCLLWIRSTIESANDEVRNPCCNRSKNMLPLNPDIETIVDATKIAIEINEEFDKPIKC